MNTESQTEKMPVKPQENKMGTMPVGRLIIQISLPMMISMFVQALYNIVDSMFVAQISEEALTAVSLAFPIQNLMISTAVGTGVGINALLSMRLGQHDEKAVTSTALHGIFLGVLSTLIFVVLGLFTPRIYLSSQTNNPEIIELGVEYLKVIMIISIGMFGAITFERLLQSTGKTVLSMVSQLAGAITNIILDPVLIFGWGIFPKMGIAGAAWATVIGQILASLIALSLNIFCNKEIKLTLRKFKLKSKIVFDIYKVGFPSIILSSLGSVLIYFLNLILGTFSATALAVLGVYFKLQSFIFMPVFGLNNGLVPIIAYNFGAKRKDRINRTTFLGALLAVVIMIIGVLLFELLPAQMLRLFNASEDMLAIGVPALRIIALSFPMAALTITFISVFQALGHGMIGMIISFVRQLVVLLPVAWLLSLLGNVDYVWWSFVVAEVVTLIISISSLKSVTKKELKDL